MKKLLATLVLLLAGSASADDLGWIHTLAVLDEVRALGTRRELQPDVASCVAESALDKHETLKRVPLAELERWIQLTAELCRRRD